MKLRNLIYICIAIILVIACVTLIYTNMNNNPIIAENNSKINNTNNISNINNSNNNSTIETNSDNNNSNNNNNNNNNKNNKNIKKDIKSPIPKKSKLTYNEAYKIAKEGSEGANYDTSKTYINYAGYEYIDGELYWYFVVYSKKNGKHINSFLINDNTGNWQ
ncbi:hypothetical protein [Methanobrevibacter curvatus]|uniref:hypothetical protein n=1 Tax=Methanobrevibacter curvatus TaxID=49547 RepID=UPI00083750C4|nr:hypothetical protein [Methanobrevibacter curvatus]